MKREYDFSKGVRGKFYRKGAQLRLPIYLDARLQRRLERLARKKGRDIGEMVKGAEEAYHYRDPETLIRDFLRDVDLVLLGKEGS